MVDLSEEKGFALYVDHNSQRQTHICQNLTSLGLKLHKAPDPIVAKDLIGKNSYRLILMQLETMGREIFPLCSQMRENDPHAVLIALMKKFRISVEERLFECGINDVVTGKHASVGVLTKRIHAHLINSAAAWSQSKTVRIGDVVIDFDRREVNRLGTVYALPGMLAELLKYFVDNANRVISRDELKISPLWVDSICAPPEEGGKTFDVNVSKLRKIIEPDPLKPEIIISVRGIGWKLSGEVVQQ